MATIDERVVSLKFNNGQFQKAVSSTIEALANLKSNLNFGGSVSGLDELSRAAGTVNLDGLNSGIEEATSKFDVMKTVGLAALATLVAKATSAGLEMAKSFAHKSFIQAPKEGLAEYELKIGSIQTILANTSKHGTELKDVTRVLDELNTYADRTIYNFGDMTRNIGLFTNAGIQIDDAATMIKGFSNEAASSGTSAANASHAAYQLSQALSAGTVRLMDWRSLTNVGMGSANMQDGLIQLGEAMGAFNSKTTKSTEAQKDFNGSLASGWLSADVMQNYLKIQAGELSEAQMKSIGLTDKQVVAFQKQAKIAEEAATKVRTFTQMVETQAEVVGSGWAQTWEIILGDFDEATELFTGISDIMTGMAESTADARNAMLKSWADMGGRTHLIEGIMNIFKAFEAILKPFKDAWAAVFPPSSNNILVTITKGFQMFTQALIIAEGPANALKNVMMFIFTILKIGGQIIGGVFVVLGAVIKAMFSASDGASKFSDVIANLFGNLTKAISNSEWITDFFVILSKVIAAPIILLRNFAVVLLSAFSNLWIVQNFGDVINNLGTYLVDFLHSTGGALSNFFGGTLTTIFTRFIERIKSFQDFGDLAKNAWMGFVDVLRNLYDYFEPVLSALAQMFLAIGENIRAVFTDVSFDTKLDILNTGLLAGLILMIRGFFKNILGMGEGAKEGLLSSFKGIAGDLSGVFSGLTDTLSAMQQNLKADTLIKIATAIGLLTASVVVLSLIDSDKLTNALIAMTIMFTNLGISMKIFEGMSLSANMGSMVLLGTTLVLFSSAILILSFALKKISSLDWGEIAKGLVGVTGLLLSLSVASRIMSKNAGNLIATGAGLIFVAIAIRVLAGALKKMSGLSWGEMIKGLFGVAATLTSLALFTQMAKVNKGAMVNAAGLILLGIALRIMADAIQDFADIDTGALIKGFVALTAVLGAIALFSKAMGNVGNIAAISIGMVLLSGALMMMSLAIRALGSMDIQTLMKGLGAMAIALGAIALAMNFMPPTMLVSAAALVVVGAALNILAGALKTMGSMPIENVGKSLLLLVGSLAAIAGAMLLMTTALPGAAALLLVSAALWVLAPVLILLGSAPWEVVLQGIGLLALAIVAIGAASLILIPTAGALLTFSAAILILGVGIQAIAIGFGLFTAALVAFATVGLVAIPIAVEMLKALIDLIPYALGKLGEGIALFTGILLENVPLFFEAAKALISTILQAIIELSPEIALAIWTVIQEILALLVNSVPAMVVAGMQIILGVLQGIRDNIYQVVEAAYEIMINFLQAIADNLPEVARAATNVIVAFLNSIGDNLPDVIQAGWDLIIDFVDGITDGIENNIDRLRESGKRLGFAVADGMSGGLLSKVGEVAAQAREMAENAIQGAKNFLGIASPSRVFTEIGEFTGEGFVLGMRNQNGSVKKQAEMLGSNAVSGVRSAMSQMSNELDANIDSNPTIRPVLDLTSVEENARRLSGMLPDGSIDMSSTATRTGHISDDYDEYVEKRSEQSAGVTEINFNQTNNSPKSLSTSEIYRRTNNQISRVKELVDAK